MPALQKEDALPAPGLARQNSAEVAVAAVEEAEAAAKTASGGGGGAPGGLGAGRAVGDLIDFESPAGEGPRPAVQVSLHVRDVSVYVCVHCKCVWWWCTIAISTHRFK